ncbi:unnamed protein product [Chironomus riparius]|uniref:Uncharacterized protein n=1 Tax=Chironomus riparius TaxID=315576 RepID=A0A9N9RXX9_9DIPT|nr:unnamed protein product [Chironomus riparius]
MRIQKVEYFKPQFGETHGLFGLRYLKHHNMRDESWKVHDLIEQYERINAVYAKDNNVKKLQHEQEEMEQSDEYKILKKQKKDKIEELQILLKGDVQRTKNVLMNFPSYMRMYQNKQSYEVLEELEYKTFMMTKTLDRYTSKREKLIKGYETRLLQIATKQEINRYYDIKEFQQERDTKRLLVEIKNSETRCRGIESINLTYKHIINQLLRDSLFYKPVIDALNYDWNEQTRLVQQTFNIGFPAINHVKKMDKEVKKLLRISQHEENARIKDIVKIKQTLREHPKLVKQFIQRDSDFVRVGDRYIRETPSMTEAREKVEKIELDIKLLKDITLSKSAEVIMSRTSEMFTLMDLSREIIAESNVKYKKVMADYETANFIYLLLFDGQPELYKEQFLPEVVKIEQAIKAEKEMQKRKLESSKSQQNLIGTMRFAMQHILNVLQHIGTEEFYIEREYPTEVLELPLLKFNSKLPEPPKILQWDFENLLEIIITKVNIMMEHYDELNKGIDVDEELLETTKTYQAAVIDDSLFSELPQSPSFEFDF